MRVISEQYDVSITLVVSGKHFGQMAFHGCTSNSFTAFFRSKELNRKLRISNYELRIKARCKNS
ncbi:MAG TPA: hypothetical protein VGP58_08880 [Pyrinomonadaceae bacterium]|nr:hypothetical protein [Pyrinomonadaceae bacterium]